MARQKPIEFITPPNTLKVKVGGGLGGIDKAAIRRAQEALKEMQSDFADWIYEEVEHLAAARNEIKSGGPTAENCLALYTRAHDLKGLGSTYDFPLVSRVAGSLSYLVESFEKMPQKIPIDLIDSHVDAIRAIVRGSIRDGTDRIGLNLAIELESLVKKCLAKNGIKA